MSASAPPVGGRAPAPAGLPVTPADRLARALLQRGGTAACALLCAWSGVWLAVWLLVVSSVLGGLVGLLGTAFTGGSAGSLGQGVVGVAWGAVSASAQALGAALRTLVLGQPLQLLASLGGGLVLSLALLAASAPLEARLLSLRGCRRMSRREAARVLPLLCAAARDLELSTLPRVLVADTGSLRVRAHVGHLVIGRALLDEIGDDGLAAEALGAVLCHGVWHWAAGDGVADRFVLCCGLPLAALYSGGCWLAEQRNALIAVAGWVVLWPAWLLVRLVLGPVAARGARRREYAADAAVAACGRGAGLHRALSFLGELESGLGGWDRALAAAHPPLELRLEALEPVPEG